MLEATCTRKRPHHLISQDAAEFVLVQKQQPLQTNQLVGLQLEPEREQSFLKLPESTNPTANSSRKPTWLHM